MGCFAPHVLSPSVSDAETIAAVNRVIWQIDFRFLVLTFQSAKNQIAPFLWDCLDRLPTIGHPAIRTVAEGDHRFDDIAD